MQMFDMLHLFFSITPMTADICIPRPKQEMSLSLQEFYDLPEDEVITRIHDLRAELGDNLLILGHHYQREER